MQSGLLQHRKGKGAGPLLPDGSGPGLAWEETAPKATANGRAATGQRWVRGARAFAQCQETHPCNLAIRFDYGPLRGGEELHTVYAQWFSLQYSITSPVNSPKKGWP